MSQVIKYYFFICHIYTAASRAPLKTALQSLVLSWNIIFITIIIIIIIIITIMIMIMVIIIIIIIPIVIIILDGAN